MASLVDKFKINVFADPSSLYVLFSFDEIIGQTNQFSLFQCTTTLVYSHLQVTNNQSYSFDDFHNSKLN